MTDFSSDAEQNPAAKSDGKKLSELFATDPLELTTEDRMEIIEALRRQRTEFIKNERKPKKETKSGTAKKAASDLSIDIGDINL